MKPVKIKTLRDFVYQLVYPAILGSMIYDIVIAANFPVSWSDVEIGRLDWSWLARGLIVILYLTDWFYTKVPGQKEFMKDRSRLVFGTFADLFSSLAFLLAFKSAGGLTESASSANFMFALFLDLVVDLGVFFTSHISTKGHSRKHLLRVLCLRVGDRIDRGEIFATMRRHPLLPRQRFC